MTINIGANNGYLRVRWTYNKQRYSLNLGIKEGKSNRLKAAQLALIIEADIEQDTFDSSLEKYKPKKTISECLTAVELFDRWVKYKSRFVDIRTTEWYKGTSQNLFFFGAESVEAIDHSKAIAFFSFLQDKGIAQETVKRQIENLRACWNWGIKTHLVKVNPWTDLPKLIKIPHSSRPRPFSKKEVNLILGGFSELYPELKPFVKFLFSTGCRTGEARALRWSDLSQNCSRCEINGQLSRKGKRKPTKTNKTRSLLLPPSLQEMLLKMRSPSSTGYVFLLGGEPVQEYAFRHRWERVLKTIGVDYRKPYNTRHTFISHALENGISPLLIAQQTGHNPKVLFDHYAGLLPNHPRLPEIF